MIVCFVDIDGIVDHHCFRGRMVVAWLGVLDTTLPQEIGCPHVFCYYCIQV
jgi:hypothetical protein